MSKKAWLGIGILCFLLVLVGDVATDLKGEVDHSRGLIIRSLLLLPSLVAFIIAVDRTWPRALLVGLVAFIMMGFNYWNLFDGFYNWLRGFGWFFTGTNDPGDAKTDNFLQAIPLALHVALKIGGSILSIYFYIKSFNHGSNKY